MASITHLALRHRRLVALAWIVLTAVGVLTVSSATSRLSHGFNTPGTAGYDANQHLLTRFGIDGNEQPTIAVLHLPAGQGMGTAAGQAAAARTFAAATSAGHLAVADYANTHSPKLISSDGRTTWALIDAPNPDVPLGTGVMSRIAIPSILTSFLLVLGLTQLISANFLVEYLVALMGLGVAIDYSLLLVTRWREEREAGRSNEEAILAGAPTAGRAVVLSGTIVAVGLLSLVLLPVPFLRSIGLGGMLIPLWSRSPRPSPCCR
jgi:uncharacterized membrane protein YdfJ with MMPL/SSD domain